MICIYKLKININIKIDRSYYYNNYDVVIKYIRNSHYIIL